MNVDFDQLINKATIPRQEKLVSIDFEKIFIFLCKSNMSYNIIHIQYITIDKKRYSVLNSYLQKTLL